MIYNMMHQHNIFIFDLFHTHVSQYETNTRNFFEFI